MKTNFQSSRSGLGLVRVLVKSTQLGWALVCMSAKYSGFHLPVFFSLYSSAYIVDDTDGIAWESNELPASLDG